MKKQNEKGEEALNPVLIRGRVFGYRGPTQFDEENLPKNPGPGCYNLGESFLSQTKSEHQSFFGSSSRFPSLKESKNLPGPGYYDTLNSSKQIGQTIPKSKRAEYLLNNYSVGPGSYFLKKEFIDMKKGVSIKGFAKSDDDSPEYLAGPGSYDVEMKPSYKSKIKYTPVKDGLKKTIFYYDNNNPGPAHYDVAGSLKLNLSTNEKGHSSYLLNSSKKKKKESDIWPGPGQYNFEDGFSLKSSRLGANPVSFTFSKSIAKAEDEFDQRLPGPGHYSIEGAETLKNKSFNKKTTIAMSSRPNNVQASMPGPGAYLQPEKLRDLQSFRENLIEMKKTKFLSSKKLNNSMQVSIKSTEISAKMGSDDANLSKSFLKDNPISFPHSERKNEFLDIKYVRSPGPIYLSEDENLSKLGGALSKSPKWSKTKSFIPFNENPGVGDYNIPSVFERKKPTRKKDLLY